MEDINLFIPYCRMLPDPSEIWHLADLFEMGLLIEFTYRTELSYIIHYDMRALDK